MKKKAKVSGVDIIKTTFKYISIGFSALSFIVFALIFLSILSLFVGTPLQTGNVAIIPVTGLITTGTDGSGFASPIGTSSEKVVEFIKKAQEDEHIKAILLEIDSPGGAPVASDEIATAVANANKTTVAVIREAGASGAFWIATAAEQVFANRMSTTGSIGVKSSYLEFSGILDQYNITYRQLIAGKYKELKSPWKEMTPEEEKIFQTLLDKLHKEFIRAIANNRGMTYEYVEQYATGMVFLGSEAKEFGFVDQLGTKQDALDYIAKKLNIKVEPVMYKHSAGLGALFGVTTEQAFYQIGRGIGSTMTTQEIQPTFT